MQGDIPRNPSDTTSLGQVVAQFAEGLGDRMSKQQAARYLGVSLKTLERHQELPRLRWGGRVWFTRSTLDSFLAKREARRA